MTIRIDSINSTEVYKFPHKIDIVRHHHHGLDRSNEITYPNVRDLRYPYNSTMAFQGLEYNVEDHIASTPRKTT